MRRCYWLASYPKSGNTWVKMFLQAYMTGVLDMNKLDFVLSDVNRYAWQAACPVPISEAGHDLLLVIRNSALAHILASSGKDPYVVKTHSINTEINGINPIPRLLTAGAVYLVRDPRDVAVSFSKHLGKTVEEAIGLMCNGKYILQANGNNGPFQMLGTWSDSVKSWKHACVVRYEDMLTSPHEQFTRILEAYRIKLNKPRLNKAIRLCDFNRLKKKEGKTRFRETSQFSNQFFTHGSSGHWRSILSSGQASRIVHDHGDVMRQHGYLENKIFDIRNENASSA